MRFYDFSVKDVQNVPSKIFQVVISSTLLIATTVVIVISSSNKKLDETNLKANHSIFESAYVFQTKTFSSISVQTPLNSELLEVKNRKSSSAKRNQKLEMLFNSETLFESETQTASKPQTTPAEKEEEKPKPLYEELGLTEYEFKVLCKMLWNEYGHGCLEGQAATVSVILNRIKSEYFPNDLVSVMKQEGQFSYTYCEEPFVEPTETMIEAIKIAFSGKDYSNGAVYYANLEKVHDEATLAWFNSLTVAAEVPYTTFFLLD